MDADKNQLELFFKYPLVSLKNEQDEEVYEGKIICQHKIISILIKHQVNVKNHNFQVRLLDDSGKEDDIIKGIIENNKFKNVIEVLDRIKVHLESQNHHQNIEDYTHIYKKVLHEYSEFTKFFLNLKKCQLKEDLSTISISTLDEKHREHTLEISINYTDKSKETFVITICDLPKRDLTEDLFQSNHSLTTLFDQFLAQVELLQPYFDLMDEIDAGCSVLDPDSPRRSDAYRRLWLGENITVMITVDPYNVFRRPDMRFLGPDRLVGNYRSKLNQNLGNWNSDHGVFQGVLNLLGIETFPQKSTQGKLVKLLVEYGECSICFCLRFNDKLPEVICKNPSCEKFYHAECLYEVVCLTGRRVYNEICGKCPICEKTINCPIPTT